MVENKTITRPFGITLQGFYKVAIVDAITNEEVWRQPEWGKNLILNQGLDYIGVNYIPVLSEYAIVGTGSRANSITSSDSTGSSAGGWFCLTPGATGIQDLTSSIYGGWSGSLRTGDVIQFADSTEINVISASNFSASVTPTTTVNSQSFTIWKTSQTSLEKEIKRSVTTPGGSSESYLTGVGNCGTTFTGSKTIHRRTYDFYSESFQRDYTEIGLAWSWRDVPGPTTSARILLPQTISVATTQRLRLVYDLEVNYSPTTPLGIVNAPLSGWPISPATNTNMSQSIQRLDTNTRYVNTNGQTAGPTYSRSGLNPVDNDRVGLFISTNSASLGPLNSPVDRSQNVSITDFTTDSAYVAGSYTLTKSGTFGVNDANGTSWASVGFGNNAGVALDLLYPYSNAQSFCMVFEQTQSKTNFYTLTFRFKYNWGRILSN